MAAPTQMQISVSQAVSAKMAPPVMPAPTVQPPASTAPKPISTAMAGAFLLTHSHALSNLKEETLIEITHTPLALVGVAAGWSRWLELRLDGRAKMIAGLVWPVAFILAGLTLVFYREA